MPGLLLDMEQPPAVSAAKRPNYGFTVAHQTVELDVDFSTQSLRGRCDIVIIPLFKDLPVVRIDAQQCNIIDGSVTVNGREATYFYSDHTEVLNIPEYIDWTANQYEMQHNRLDRIKTDLSLAIAIPDSVRIEEVNPFSETAASTMVQRAATIRGASIAANDPISATPKTAAENVSSFQPLTISISFTVENFRSGLHFVGMTALDKRFPHVYTRHSVDPGTASCIFPCIDDPTLRCTWSISIKCSRTLGDAMKRKHITPDVKASHHHKRIEDLAHGVTPEDYQIPLSEEEKLLDMAVVCSGFAQDEIIDLADNSKKIVTFEIGSVVGAQHIGFAIGPFEQVDLASEFREEDDDEKLGQGQALPVWGYCLPGRVDELRNTCFNVVHAVDWFVLTFGSFPFPEAKFVFVEDQIQDVEHTASLTLCSSRLLYPEDIIDPERENMRTLAHALASQWMGVGIIPNEPLDRWVTIGLSHFMTGLYMKVRCGTNDYLFRQKAESDRLVELDVARPPLTVLGTILDLGPFEYDFMALKAPLVLFILDKRIVKATGSAGLSRVITKIIMGSNTSGENVLTSESFRKQIEKITKYRQTEPFWNQWVLNSGCPRIQIHQKFNKKRSMIEMKIYQKQSDLLNQPRTIPKEDFLREFKEAEVDAGEIQRFFTGPMTIRIHEADGTPYEHIVEIRGPVEHFEIPYSTKYKRLKRSRRKREQANAALAIDMNEEVGEDALYYSLGDVLQDPAEIQEWELYTWSESDSQNMDHENYEWFRIDADFEWLCSKEFTSMPSWMYISQLQQDRDVVAHQESMLFLKSQPSHPLVATFCTKTLMDPRYNYNIRLMAADILKNHATQGQNWLGFKHLEKAYGEFFCYPGSKTPRPNDFENAPAYMVSKAIPTAVSQIRGPNGRCPKVARNFILDQLRFNDNQNNEYSDNFKVASLLNALTDCVIPLKTKKDEVIFDNDEEDDEPKEFLGIVVEELDRHLRMDEWLDSYQNIYTTTVLGCKWKLMKAGVIPKDPLEFAKYIHDGTFDLVRCKAFEALLDLGFLKNTQLVEYLMNVMSTDISPFVRGRLFEVFCAGLAVVAFGDGPEKPIAKEIEDEVSGGLVVVEDVSTVHRKSHEVRTTTIAGALAALKEEMGGDVALKKYIWKAVQSSKLGWTEQISLLEICGILYDPLESMPLKMKLPRYWRAKYEGKVCFKRYPSS